MTQSAQRLEYHLPEWSRAALAAATVAIKLGVPADLVWTVLSKALFNSTNLRLTTATAA